MSGDPRIGTELAGYRIESLLGRGGMSVVYLAEQEFPKRKVALKLLAPELAEDGNFRERFVRESNAAASIDHPNIIPIYGAGEAAGVLYIAMRYVEGTDLRMLLDADGPLDPIRAVSIVSQAASALDTAHARGLVHRDVKPGNILLAARPSGSGPLDHVYVSDFGLIKRRGAEKNLTRSGQIMGSVDYIAPEQILGKPVDGRADVYSLGCVLYKCLTGEVPFPGDIDAAAMWAHVHEKPPQTTAKRPELSAGIDDVIAKAMAKDPADRYATCGALAEAGRQALGEPAAAPPAREWSMKRRLMAGAVVVAVAAVAAFAFTRLGGSGSKTITGCEAAAGSLSDRSFNQAIYGGLTRSATALGISVKAKQLDFFGDRRQYRANIQSFIDQRCSLIVALPFQQDIAEQAARANPQQKFLFLDPTSGRSSNALDVIFRVDQAAFLAGYLAADLTDTGKIATFGGAPVPVVTIYMNGFAAGVLKYNLDRGTHVQLLGWDPARQTGTFVTDISPNGAFVDADAGQELTERFISQGADIVFPVAGGAGLGAGKAARDADNVRLVGVDFDEFFAAPQFADLWITSVRKRYDVAVEDAMKLVVDGKFLGGVLPGTLANGSVDLAPFHDFNSQVPEPLRAELDRLKAGVIAGTVSVNPKDYLGT
jgi:basic membrane lipoprotein Med (substrate-binding protein (PBP1-ABC) superfamily)